MPNQLISEPNTGRADLDQKQFLDVLLSDVSLLDVRAPVEFNAGGFPASLNIPLLDDEQRHLIGCEYAENGQASAVELGLRLATPEIRAQRLAAWQKFVSATPDGYLYCFRGGLRSKITQQWLADAGYYYPVIKGGYKALRRWALDQLDRLCDTGNIILISGMTGVGKTELIQAYSSAIDLEGRALHRGSAFGKLSVEQPTQINWENQIILDWLKSEARANTPVLLEAESRQIGKIHLPKPIQHAMNAAQRVILQAPLYERVERLFNDYVVFHLAHYEKMELDPWATLETSVFGNLRRIRNRLGGASYGVLCGLLPDAINTLRDYQDPSAVQNIIKRLLIEYYDPQYQYHEKKNRANTVFKGNMLEIQDWLNCQHKLNVNREKSKIESA